MRQARFYLPSNPEYTILDSLHDSVRFARHCLVPYRNRNSVSQVATFVDPDGTPVYWKGPVGRATPSAAHITCMSTVG
jgi:hypothetical protein